MTRPASAILSSALSMWLAVAGAEAADPEPAGRATAPVTEVEIGDLTYSELGEYQQTQAFRQSGGRCGTIPRLSSSAAALLAVSDCSMTQSDNLNDYPPVSTYYVPVWFHVIRKDDGVTGDVSDALLESQIEVMNEDLLAMAGTPGANGVNTRIEFYLAGVSRYDSTAYFDECFYVGCSQANGANSNEAFKNALNRRPDLYLNFYTKAWPDRPGLLGYATFPAEDAEAARDGVVINWRNVGRDAPAGAPYDQGRTGTHEVGHYIGLFHTFQSGCGTAGSPGCYSSGDLICDTNPESTEHFGCTASNTCTSADPIENYMNYTDDTCMEEFTAEQARRARCSIVNYRSTMLTVTSLRSSGKIYVDGAYLGTELGTSASPFNTVREAYDLAWDGAEIAISGGSYPETFALTKQVVLSERAGTGTVTIGE
jgi:hypothetical protein